jgi:putative ABC transport system permease protein
MRALTRKLLRYLWATKGQGLAIALVITGGVATYVMSLSTLDSLRQTQSIFYRDYRFAHVFASVKRAPETLRERIAEINGVRTVQTHVLAPAIRDLEGNSGLIAATVVSLPDHGQPLLNRLHLRRGRFVDSARDDEALISDAFASARGLKPGDAVRATIYGRRRMLRIAGIALSPEHICQIQTGASIPDFANYAVVWMARTPLENACDLEGAFNTLAIELTPDGEEQDVIDRLDDLLRRYGGLGAFGRRHQISHRYLSEEFRQIESMATMFPAIFLGVAAFLLNVVVSRLLATEREQVAILKAFGHSNLAIVLHYLKYILVIVLAGSIGGVLFGAWLGQGMSNMYMEFYRFPFLIYRLRPPVAITATLISAASAILATLHTVIRAARIPPAEAMQPAPPARYRVSIVERLGLRRLLGQPARMIVRNIERRPVKSALSVTGVGFACAIMITGGLFRDSINHLMDVYFKLSQTDDISLSFTEPVSAAAVHSLVGVQGVENVEGFRTVPVTLRFQHRSYRTSIQAYPDSARLKRLLSMRLEAVRLPPWGLMMTDYLAGTLGVKPGDTLRVEALEGRRPVRDVAVAGGTDGGSARSHAGDRRGGRKDTRDGQLHCLVSAGGLCREAVIGGGRRCPGGSGADNPSTAAIRHPRPAQPGRSRSPGCRGGRRAGRSQEARRRGCRRREVLEEGIGSSEQAARQRRSAAGPSGPHGIAKPARCGDPRGGGAGRGGGAARGRCRPGGASVRGFGRHKQPQPKDPGSVARGRPGA